MAASKLQIRISQFVHKIAKNSNGYIYVLGSSYPMGQFAMLWNQTRRNQKWKIRVGGLKPWSGSMVPCMKKLLSLEDQKYNGESSILQMASCIIKKNQCMAPWIHGSIDRRFVYNLTWKSKQKNNLSTLKFTKTIVRQCGNQQNFPGNYPPELRFRREEGIGVRRNCHPPLHFS